MGAKGSDMDAHEVPCSSRALGHKGGGGGLRVDTRYPSPDLVFSVPCPPFPGEVNMGVGAQKCKRWGENNDFSISLLLMGHEWGDGGP